MNINFISFDYLFKSVNVIVNVNVNVYPNESFIIFFSIFNFQFESHPHIEISIYGKLELID